LTNEERRGEGRAREKTGVEKDLNIGEDLIEGSIGLGRRGGGGGGGRGRWSLGARLLMPSIG